MNNRSKQSWDNCEDWYRLQIQEKQQTFLIPMLEFVQEIRAMGYDEVFYLSRFGIHPNFSRRIIDINAVMMIHMGASGTISVKMLLKDKVFELENVKLELSSEIRTLLELLAAHIAESEEA